MMGFKPGDKDTSWFTPLKTSEKLSITLMEDCVFKTDFDLHMKHHKIQRSPTAELLDKGPLKSRMDAIHAALVEEGDAKPHEEARVGMKDIGDTSSDDDEGTPQKKDVKQQVQKVLIDALKPWANFIKNKCSRVIKLVVDPGSPHGVCELISSWLSSLELVSLGIPTSCASTTPSLQGARVHGRICG